MLVNEVLGWRRHRWWAAKRPYAEVPDAPLDSHDTRVVDSDVVWSALRTLPARQRAVLVLRYYDDLSEQQIADTLGIRPGTVKSQASAGLADLRGALVSQSEEEGRTP